MKKMFDWIFHKRCPVCKSTNVSPKYEGETIYYKCNSCGHCF